MKTTSSAKLEGVLPGNIYNSDCLEILKLMGDNSVDAIVTDPPAGIAFMGKEWDTDKGGRDEWIKWLSGVMAEGLRVLKPGAHALVWALPRTSHWTGTALENAGFEVRDCVYHLFGSGFPKSLDISKAIDKQAGEEPEVVGFPKAHNFAGAKGSMMTGHSQKAGTTDIDITTPKSPEAKQWEGWGTSLKPAVENWWLCRKPLSENTVAENVLKHGTGGINIDGSRIGTEERFNMPARSKYSEQKEKIENDYEGKTAKGRFPANLIHDGSDAVLAEFDKAGRSVSSDAIRKNGLGDTTNWRMARQEHDSFGFDDSGSPARFFYSAKPSSSEKNLLYGEFEETERFMQGNYSQSPTCKTCNLTLNGTNDHSKCSGEVYYKEMKKKSMANGHPTVKSQALMQYLVKLITPPKGIVLDPFAGSGSTLLAAKYLGHPFIGIELSEEYCKIAEARLKQGVLF